MALLRGYRCQRLVHCPCQKLCPFDPVTESLNVGDDNRAAMLLLTLLACPFRKSYPDVTLADDMPLTVRRFDERWISAARGDVSYELDRQNGNLTYASSTMKDGIADNNRGRRCTLATVPGR